MMTTAPEAPLTRTLTRQRVAWPRLLWVAPLTVVAALAVNQAIKFAVQAIDPRLQRMPQLGAPLISLTVVGVLAAIVAFIAVGLLTRRPFFWYPVIAAGALLLSWIPDIMLAIGGQPALLATRFVSPFAFLFGGGFSGGPPPGSGGPPPGGTGGAGGPGGPGFGGPPAAPIEQVLILMLLHLATAAVCVLLLTRLTRKRAAVT